MSSKKEEIKSFYPDFIGIGAQKAGTTTLFEKLKSHPEVYIPDKKELNFFNVKTTYAKGIDWYANKYFSAEEAQQAASLGEITPTYLTNIHAPQRIFESLGNKIKFLCILRDPTERAYSHYIMLKKTGKIKESFEKALKLENEGKSKTNLITNSLYGEFLKIYFSYFPKENFLILKMEDFFKEHFNADLSIQNFLNIGDFPIDKKGNNIKKNKGEIPRFNKGSLFYKKTPLLDWSRNKIKNNPSLENFIKKLLLKSPPNLSKKEKIEMTNKYFQKDIDKLEKLLNISLTNWKK